MPPPQLADSWLPRSTGRRERQADRVVERRRSGAAVSLLGPVGRRRRRRRRASDHLCRRRRHAHPLLAAPLPLHPPRRRRLAPSATACVPALLCAGRPRLRRHLSHHLSSAQRLRLLRLRPRDSNQSLGLQQRRRRRRKVHLDPFVRLLSAHRARRALCCGSERAGVSLAPTGQRALKRLAADLGFESRRRRRRRRGRAACD